MRKLHIAIWDNSKNYSFMLKSLLNLHGHNPEVIKSIENLHQFDKFDILIFDPRDISNIDQFVNQITIPYLVISEENISEESISKKLNKYHDSFKKPVLPNKIIKAVNFIGNRDRSSDESRSTTI